MSGQTHTPGPWVAGRDASIEQHRTGVLLAKCQVHIGSFVEQMELARSNARLMAAAPDLLSALQRCVDELAPYADEEEGDDQSIGAVVRQARAVISQATGE